MSIDKFSGTFERASLLRPSIGTILACHLDDVYDHASRKKWRVKVTVTPDGAPKPGIDNAVAWFPPDHATFAGHACLSGLLTEDGNLSPASHVMGWIQVHRDIVIWLGWAGDNNLWIDWDDVYCIGNTLFGNDQHGTRWTVRFDIWWAGFAPEWPDWLLD